MPKQEALQKINSNYKEDQTNKIRPGVLLLLHGNYTCNASCIYCEHGELRKEYKDKIIEEQTVREIVQKLGPILREVTWHGGEPLLLPESLFEALEDEKKKRGYNFETTLQTNSILLTEDKQKFLENLGINWGTSFDGLYNNDSRGKLSTDGIFSLIERKKKLGFITVYYRDTIKYMIENYEYYKKIGANNVQSCVVRENVISGSNPFIVPNEEAIPQVLEYFKYWIYDTDNPITDTYLERHLLRVLGKTHLCEDINCIGGWLICDPLGNITTCGHYGAEEPYCNIHDIEDYRDFLSNKKWLNDKMKQRELMKKCRDEEQCIWYPVCYGGCMGLNYECDHNYEKLSERNCEFHQGILNGIYEIIKDFSKEERAHLNPIVAEILDANNYFSLTEIKELEGVKTNG